MDLIVLHSSCTKAEFLFVGSGVGSMISNSRMSPLALRSSIGWLRERDIDLLLCAELHAAGPIRQRFAALCSSPGVAFSGAWVSHSEVDGESDLLIAFNAAARHFIFLVENKVAAEFQPDQAQRYADRAARWRGDGSIDVKSVLICPAAYFSRPSTELFDVALSYEELIQVARESKDERSEFLAMALSEGIASYRRGYTAVPNKAVTSIWEAIWRTAQREQPALNMARPSEKPGKSTWIYFRRPSGFSEGDTRRCVIVYKASRGQVDLQFAGMMPENLEAVLADLTEPYMQVVTAGKSASLRISVPVIDFDASEDLQLDKIRVGLGQVERLRRFFVENRIGERLGSSHGS